MKTIIKVLVAIPILFIVGYVWLYFAISDVTFIDDMKGTYEPIPEREEETREQAQEYLDTVFTGEHYTIYDIAFDSNDPDTF